MGAKPAGLILASFPQEGDPSQSGWANAFADVIDRHGLDSAGSEFVWGGARFDAASAKWIRQGFLEHAPHALAAILRRVLATQSSVASMSERLAHLAVPTLVIAGEDDSISLDVSRALARSIPRATLAVVPGAGHVVNLQKPEAFNGVVSDFLRQIEV